MDRLRTTPVPWADRPADTSPLPAPAAPVSEPAHTAETPVISRNEQAKDNLPPASEPVENSPAPTANTPLPSAEEAEKPFAEERERPYVTKVILTGDRLRKYFPDVSMTPREIEESVYGALEERRQRQERMKLKSEMLKGKKAPER